MGVEKGDEEENAQKLIRRILGYRIFSGEDGKMNKSVKEVNGQVLVVSQFTLAADTKKGARPSFSSAAPPDEGERLYDYAVEMIKNELGEVSTGEFGADMRVSLQNDGPVTFWLQVP